MAKRTSVIVPCWVIDDTLLHLTQRCLETVRDTSDVELIVVDNGSTLGKDFMRDISDIYIRNKDNTGYTVAMNQGIKLSHGHYIVCGNNDYFVENGWEQILVEVLENTKNCITITPNTNTVSSLDVWSIDLPGSWFMIKKSVMFSYGLLDERFKIIHSDSDLAVKIKKSGKIMCETNLTKAEHFRGASLSRIKDNGHEFISSYAKFMNKWEQNG